MRIQRDSRIAASDLAPYFLQHKLLLHSIMYGIQHPYILSKIVTSKLNRKEVKICEEINKQNMKNNIVLQGLPGIGKTTLIKKIANKLKEMTIEVAGFYTEELRDNNNYRIGFDVVTLDHKRGILARKSSGSGSKYKVGTYDVHIEEFEEIVMPLFNNISSIFIIDEIGKMELFSKKFQTAVENVISDENITIIATVPLKGIPPLVQKIKQSDTTNLITVNQFNRDKLLEEIIKMINK